MRTVLARIRTLLPRLAVLLGALAGIAPPAQATFHLWSIAEAFSSTDGTVQYVEFQALAGGQQFLQGHTLTASGGPNPPRSITFATSLPGDSAGRRFLVAKIGRAHV